MDALILVDLQNDFTPATADKPAGALAVPEGNDVVPIANQLIGRFPLVVATQDWHPPDHRSFASQHPGRDVFDTIELDGLEQILWPDHCVQHTTGAEFLPTLTVDRVDRVFRKGTDRDIDSYSGFYDNGHRKATGLADYLKQQGVDTVYILGLATDVCVKHTAVDAVRLGFETCVIYDACRGVDMAPGDVDRAWQQMREAGAALVHSERLLPDAG
jgi:nicotinamidase/pyrazinamidase